jgi:hypothetical protein
MFLLQLTPCCTASLETLAAALSATKQQLFTEHEDYYNVLKSLSLDSEQIHPYGCLLGGLPL